MSKAEVQYESYMLEVRSSGLLVASDPEAPVTPEPAPLPILKGWHYSKTGERYHDSRTVEFRMRALEDLYTAVSPGGGGITDDETKRSAERLTGLLNELSVALPGGIPEGYEEYT